MPIAWTADRRVALIAGRVVGPGTPDAQAIARDAPFAFASPLGVLVSGGGKAQLWKVPAPGGLDECAVSPDAKRVACRTANGRAALLKAGVSSAL